MDIDSIRDARLAEDVLNPLCKLRDERQLSAASVGSLFDFHHEIDAFEDVPKIMEACVYNVNTNKSIGVTTVVLVMSVSAKDFSRVDRNFSPSYTRTLILRHTIESSGFLDYGILHSEI